jgi:hypothetical protein
MPYLSRAVVGNPLKMRIVITRCEPLEAYRKSSACNYPSESLSKPEVCELSSYASTVGRVKVFDVHARSCLQMRKPCSRWHVSQDRNLALTVVKECLYWP